jgi:hypothetical protein
MAKPHNATGRSAGESRHVAHHRQGLGRADRVRDHVPLTACAVRSAEARNRCITCGWIAAVARELTTCSAIGNPAQGRLKIDHEKPTSPWERKGR